MFDGSFCSAADNQGTKEGGGEDGGAGQGSMSGANVGVRGQEADLAWRVWGVKQSGRIGKCMDSQKIDKTGPFLRTILSNSNAACPSMSEESIQVLAGYSVVG